MTELVKRTRISVGDGYGGVEHVEIVLAADHDRVVQEMENKINYWRDLAKAKVSEVERLRAALEHIRVMQLRGFIVLGDQANGLMQAALADGKED